MKYKKYIYRIKRIQRKNNILSIKTSEKVSKKLFQDIISEKSDVKA